MLELTRGSTRKGRRVFTMRQTSLASQTMSPPGAGAAVAPGAVATTPATSAAPNPIEVRTWRLAARIAPVTRLRSIAARARRSATRTIWFICVSNPSSTLSSIGPACLPSLGLTAPAYALQRLLRDRQKAVRHVVEQDGRGLIGLQLHVLAGLERASPIAESHARKAELLAHRTPPPRGVVAQAFAIEIAAPVIALLTHADPLVRATSP